MADLTEEQRKNSAASLRSIADLLDPPVPSQPTSPSTPSTPVPPSTPASTVPPLDPRFLQVAFTDFPGTSLPSDFYAYAHSPGNEGVGWRDPAQVAVKDGNLVITASGDTLSAKIT